MSVALDNSTISLPANSRTVTTLTNYLANNAVFNVLDYGADPTGAVDAAPAFNAAFTAGTGNIIYVPPGSYKIGSTLVVPTDTQFIGVMWKTFLVPTTALNNSVVLRIGNGSCVDGINLNGSSTTGAIGLASGDLGSIVDLPVARNMEIMNFAGSGAAGIKLGQVVSGRFECLYVQFNDTNLLTGPTVNTPTDTIFYKCQFREATHKGVYLQTGFSLLFLSCLFEANGEEGLYVTNTATCTIDNLVLQECWFESNWTSLTGAPRLAQYEAWIKGSLGVCKVTPTFRDCQFDGSVVQSIRLTDAYDFNIDHCSFTNTQMILIEGIAFGIFSNWRNVANANSYLTGNYITNTSTNQVTCTTPQHGTTVPTVGEHRVNDIQWHSTPTASGFAGWICVAAGSPGTWQPFGFIGPNLAVAGAFGCNGATAHTAAPSGGAAPLGGTGTAAGGWDTAAHRDAAITLLNNIRAALVANGIMS